MNNHEHEDNDNPVRASQMSEQSAVNKNGKLFGRIAKAMLLLRRLPEDGYNQHDKYKYTKASTVIAEAGKAAGENGIAILPIVVHEATTKPQGEKAFHATVEIDFYVCDEDGNAFVSRWVGKGMNFRTPDKALKTAITNAKVSFYSTLFMIGAGEEDPEIDEQQPTQETRVPPQKTPPSARGIKPPVPQSEGMADDAVERGEMSKRIGTLFEHDIEGATAWILSEVAKSTQTKPVASVLKLGEEGAKVANEWMVRNWDDLRSAYGEHVEETTPYVSPAQLKRLHAVGTKAYGKNWDGKRKSLVEAITAKRPYAPQTSSSKEMFEDEASTLIDGIQSIIDKQAEETETPPF